MKLEEFNKLPMTIQGYIGIGKGGRKRKQTAAMKICIPYIRIQNPQITHNMSSQLGTPIFC